MKRKIVVRALCLCLILNSSLCYALLQDDLETLSDAFDTLSCSLTEEEEEEAAIPTAPGTVTPPPKKGRGQWRKRCCKGGVCKPGRRRRGPGRKGRWGGASQAGCRKPGGVTPGNSTPTGSGAQTGPS